MNAAAGFQDVIADLGFCRLGTQGNVRIAETEMPGLMAIRGGIFDQPTAPGRARHRLAAHDHPGPRC